MRAFTIHFETDVAGEALTRCVGLLDDMETLVVARRAPGGNIATAELEISISDAQRLAEAILAGDQRAKTFPAATRILCASGIMFARVSAAAGGLQTIWTPLATEELIATPDVEAGDIGAAEIGTGETGQGAEADA
ncbi:MAG: hypothetical protein KF723_23070 [Rhizobiaceae bacterium]|nr:hypothetical protein [Rhizobiaceae bacterium]